MPLPEKQIYTVKDIYSLPEGTRAELIDGEIYYIAPPSVTHQRISMKLSHLITKYIEDNHGTCEVFAAPFAVFLNKDDKNYVEPDISVICDKDKLDTRGCKGAPDWVVEIVSPSSRYMDYYTKLVKYREAGVREYWIVDPMKEKIVVWNLEQLTEPSGPDIMEIYTFNDIVKAGIYEELYIDFSKITL